jgi:hypothetical protein
LKARTKSRTAPDPFVFRQYSLLIAASSNGCVRIAQTLPAAELCAVAETLLGKPVATPDAANYRVALC